MIDNLEERLAAGDLLTMGERHDHLLWRPPISRRLTDSMTHSETIKSKGMYPIIAHPERYIYMSEDDYARLRSMGVSSS